MLQGSADRYELVLESGIWRSPAAVDLAGKSMRDLCHLCQISAFQNTFCLTEQALRMNISVSCCETVTHVIVLACGNYIK